jgi:hypothetical protein
VHDVVATLLGPAFIAAAIFGVGCGPQSEPSTPNEKSVVRAYSAPEPSNSLQRWETVPVPFDLKTHYSRELFVSPEGDDKTGTGSADRPLATIGRAASMAAPGTRINIRPGVYGGSEDLRHLQGTEAEPIALVAQGDVVIDGDGRELGLHLSDPRYVVIEGLTIRNTWPHGVNIDDGGSFDSPAEYIVLRNLRFQNVGNGGNNDCLKMSGVQNFWVLSSEFEDCDRGEAIDMVGCHEGVVSANHFHHIPQHAVQTKGGSADVLIHANRFSDVAGRSINAGGHTGSPYFRPLDSPYEAARIHMVANLFEKSGDTPVAFVGCEACVFANNTIVVPQLWITRVLWQNTDKARAEHGLYINNLVVMPSPYATPASVIDVGRGASTKTFTFDANLIVVRGVGGASPKRAFTEWSKQGFRMIADEELYGAMLAGNYDLKLGNPAIRTGRIVPGGLPTDFDGRTFEDPPSVGAFRRP